MSDKAMEVTLAAARASSVLNAVSDLIWTAIDVYPSLKEKLQSLAGEINKAKHVVDLIRSQKGLQTSGVVAGIRMLESHGKILESDLMSLGKNKDGNSLKTIGEKLKEARKSLIQYIRLASVGLAKDDLAITVDTKVVKSTDEAVKKILGKELGLDIALFLARLKRNPDAKGKIRLTEKDYEYWTRHQTEIAHPESTTLSTEVKTRIVVNCLARDQSIQILGAVGVDLWASIAFIKIEGLVSMNEAIQIAVPITLDVFQKVLDTQSQRIAASRPKG
ncbi:hypothetical protein BGZ57DRAFT_930721 [Hyaloscypha finlandica]|nr:hypothetical protein F5882DRAFT_49454 [Hyaloscypha sp. PMI_1271]KAH8765173.1 hypothetical protein BGZ57DRAFT_930721 [Hyaloscypha finlandica]